MKSRQLLICGNLRNLRIGADILNEEGLVCLRAMPSTDREIEVLKGFFADLTDHRDS